VPCGIMLREALKQEDIAVLILYDEPPKRFDISEVDDTQPSNGCGLLWQFFGWVEAGAFEISADAFTTFRVRPPPDSPLCEKSRMMDES